MSSSPSVRNRASAHATYNSPLLGSIAADGRPAPERCCRTSLTSIEPTVIGGSKASGEPDGAAPALGAIAITYLETPGTPVSSDVRVGSGGTSWASPVG